MRNAWLTSSKWLHCTLKDKNQSPVQYKTLNLECRYRLDFLVEDKLVIELKSVEALLPIFEAQILTYMRLADKPLGLLMNFNAQVLKHGLKSGVPTEEVLAEMRESDPPICYLVGTPKGRL